MSLSLQVEIDSGPEVLLNECDDLPQSETNVDTDTPLLQLYILSIHVSNTLRLSNTDLNAFFSLCF